MRRSRSSRCSAVVVARRTKIVESPASQIFGKTIVSGPKNERVVALTYDDGPNPPYTERIARGAARRTRPRDVLRRRARGRSLSARRAPRGRRAATRSAIILGATATCCSMEASGLRRTLERTDRAIYRGDRRAHADHAAAFRRARLARARRGAQARLHAGDVVGAAGQRLGVSARASDCLAGAALRRRRRDHRSSRRQSRHRLRDACTPRRGSATAAPTSRRRA